MLKSVHKHQLISTAVAPSRKIQEYVKYLSRVEILNSLLAAEKQQVAKALMEKHFSKNEVIIQQGPLGSPGLPWVMVSLPPHCRTKRYS